MAEGDYESAGVEAEKLARLVEENGSLAPVFDRLDAAIPEIEAAGATPADLLPASAEPGIGFSLNQKRDGRTLWQAIAIAAQGAICDPDGEVWKQFSDKGDQVKSGALVGAVITAVGLPPLAITVAVAISAVILGIGIRGFCDWVSAQPDEP